jgi:hypothetical protein
MERYPDRRRDAPVDNQLALPPVRDRPSLAGW